MGIRAARTDSLNRLLVGVVDDSGENIYIQRLTASGEIDDSFNYSRIDCWNDQRATHIRDVKIDSNNDVYAIVDCGVYESAVVKLKGLDGEYDQAFADGGFLWLSDALANQNAVYSYLNSIAIDSEDKIYVLGQVGETVASQPNQIVNGVWRFNAQGQVSNFSSQPLSNRVTMAINDDSLVLGDIGRSGIIEYDTDTNEMMLTGKLQAGHNLMIPNDMDAFISDIWITRLNATTGLLRWDENDTYWTSGLTESSSTAIWNAHDYTVTDITMDDAGWLTVVGFDQHTFTNSDGFGVQVKPNAESPYWLDFNVPTTSDHDCRANTVIADSRNGFYVAGYCNSNAFLQRYNADTTFDVMFQPPSGNLTPYPGGFEPNYFVGSGEALSLVGFMWNFSSPSPYSVALIKYRTVAYDDTPPAPAPAPAVAAPAPAPIVAAPVPAPIVAAPVPAAPAAPAAPVQPTMTIKQKTAGSTLATQIGMTVTPKAKIKLTVAKASKKICKVSGGKLVALKPGNCSVTVSVTPKKTKQIKKPKTTKQSTVVRIS
jgi:hypothetical protein